MSVAVTVRMTVQTSHETWQYAAIETRVFPDTASLREVMNWATNNGERHLGWSDLVLTRVTLAEGVLSSSNPFASQE